MHHSKGPLHKLKKNNSLGYIKTMSAMGVPLGSQEDRSFLKQKKKIYSKLFLILISCMTRIFNLEKLGQCCNLNVDVLNPKQKLVE